MTEGDPLASKKATAPAEPKQPMSDEDTARAWLSRGQAAGNPHEAKRALDLAAVHASLATVDAVKALDARIDALFEGIAAVRAQLAEAEHSAWLDRL